MKVNGDQSVMITGQILMLMLHVAALDFYPMVSGYRS